jgi:CubicO group peptidase (beta-lactamase class C family)
MTAIVTDQIETLADPLLESVLPKLDARMAELAARYRVPGLAVGVVRNQRLAWHKGYGFADIATERRPDEHTLFRVGSITKTVTATALVQLRDAGKLRLDDSIVRHLPEFAAVRNPFGDVEDVTLRRRLTHRSGLMGEPPLGQWERLEFPSIEQIIAVLPQISVVIEPDSAFKYSNLAFSLLGEVVARVSGRPYVEYVQDEILVPLGMAESTFSITDALQPQLATGYQPSPFADLPAPAPHPLIAGMTSAGQLYSSVADLAKWIALQFRTEARERSDAQVLRGPSLAEMHTPLYMEPDWTAGYALSWMLMRKGNNVYGGHGGGIHGFISQIMFSTPHRTGAIALVNGAGPAQEFALEALELIVAAEKERKPTLPAQPPKRTPPEWQRFLGRYGFNGGQQTIECRDGRLLLVIPTLPGGRTLPPAELEPTGEPLVFIVRGGRYSGESLTFRQSDDGTVTGFVSSEFVYKRLIGPE